MGYVSFLQQPSGSQHLLYNIYLTLCFRCLWFIMEPLVARSEDYNYQFFRRLIETIKQAKDAQGPEDDEMNFVCKLKLYFICSF